MLVGHALGLPMPVVGFLGGLGADWGALPDTLGRQNGWKLYGELHYGETEEWARRSAILPWILHTRVFDPWVHPPRLPRRGEEPGPEHQNWFSRLVGWKVYWWIYYLSFEALGWIYSGVLLWLIYVLPSGFLWLPVAWLFWHMAAG
jgi:hypothetical protein